MRFLLWPLIFIAFFVILLLSGCGTEGGQANIAVQQVTQEALNQIAWDRGGEAETYLGYAIWDGDGGCTIYMMSPDNYSKEVEQYWVLPDGTEVWNSGSYTAVLGHETRHCLEGDFHQ